MSEWQPIATAPDDTEVLVWDEGAIDIAIHQDGEQWFGAVGGIAIEPPPTHWMPLPAPPDGGMSRE